MSIAVPFPKIQPAGYEWFDDEVPFDAERHLALTEPDEVLTLADLGYNAVETAGKASATAVSSSFRVLSDEGTEVMLATARRLRVYARRAGNRIERTTRGGCYRSRWLRDLCIDQSVSDHLAAIYGVDIAPHAMPVHLGHLNYEPAEVNVSIDKWHHDTLPLDYVLTVTDPTITPGGRFEYFLGTKTEAAELAAKGQTPPAARVVAPDLPGPGYAVALHGNMVVHRAAPLSATAERITMVNGYVATDATIEDQSRTIDLIGVDDDAVLWTEWAKFVAWRSRDRLDAVVEELAFTNDQESVIASLEAGIDDVRRAITEMRAIDHEQEHYELASEA